MRAKIVVSSKLLFAVVRVSFCLFLLLVALSAFGQQVATNNATVVPPLVNFSGTLTDINGKPLTSIVGVTFFLYNDQQAASPLWLETQNVTPDKYGRYSVQLGSTSSTGLPADIFVAGEARWLGVQPQGQAEYPRVMLLSVPYALKAGDAQTIGGLPPSAFLLAPSAVGTTSSTRTAGSAPPTSGPVTGSGTVNFLPLWDGTSDITSSALFQSGSAPTAMIGINTATPAATLDVATGDVLLEAGNLDLPQTSSATNGVIMLGGAPFISACCSSTSFNTFVGTNAGNFNTVSGASGDNTAVGYQALTNNTSTTNTAVGSTALKANTTGSSNTAVGTASLQVNTTGGSNTAVGAGALESNGLGLWNTALGSGAGHSNTTGTNNTFVGQAADAGAQNLTNATAIGSAAIVGESNALVLGAPGVNVGIGTATPAYSLDVRGSGNFTGMVTFAPGQTFPGTGNGTITGVTSGTGLTGGGSTGNVTLNVDPTQVPFLNAANVLTGNQTVNGNLSATGLVTGSALQIGSNLFAFGTLANNNAFLGFAGNTTATGNWNTATGTYALGNDTTGFENTATGSQALFANSTGIANTATGNGALYANTTGLSNTATGSSALLFSTTGNYDTATGGDALGENTTGGYNTATGSGALYYNSTGNYNTATGFNAGITADRGNMGGSLNTFLGYQAVVGTGTLSNATAIGANAEVDESNALVLGSIYGVNQSFASTNVGIGTTKPQYTLDVHGNANFTGLVNFAPNQTFPGNGTVSSVGSGAGLTGGPIISSGTLSIAPAGVTNAMLANPSLTVSPGPGLTGGGSVPLGSATTLSLDTTQVPLLNTANNIFTGNQTVNGNVSATGLVTGTAFNIGSNLFAFGSYAIGNAFSGFAGNSTMTGANNTATGATALFSNTTGVNNTASGFGALYFNTANYNTASGFEALYSNTTGYFNAASGSQALYLNTTGYANTASGSGSLGVNTAGYGNTGDGQAALASNTTGNANTGTGDSALFNNTTGNFNTGTGGSALVSNTTGNYNTGVGVFSGMTGDGSAISGQGNTLLGTQTALGTGTFNNATAVGAYAEVGASNSLVLGSIAGVNNCTAANSCASTNVGIGTITPAYTLDVHGTGNFSGLVTFAPNQTFPGTGNGTITGVTPTTGGGLAGGGTSGSVALGLTNSCASGQVLQWSGAAWACTTISGGGTLTGITAGTDLTGGGTSGNVTLNLDTSKVPQLNSINHFGANQVISGNLTVTGTVAAITARTISAAQSVNSNGSYLLSGGTFLLGSFSKGNAFLGFSGNSTTTGTANTGSGLQALLHNTAGMNNTAIGAFALLFNSTGLNNTAVGYQALFGNTTGGDLTCIGYKCTAVNGLKNATAIGAYAVVGASNALVLGGTGEYAVKVGIGTPTPTSVLTIAKGAGPPLSDGWTTYSSRRWKTNIQTLHGALGKVEQLRGVSYDLKGSGKHEVGVIAEEVGAVVPEVVSYEENGKDARGVDYSRLTALLIEATKEQQREFRKEQAELANALRQIKQQQSLLRAQAAAMQSLKAEVRATHETLRKVKAQVADAQPALVAVK